MNQENWKKVQNLNKNETIAIFAPSPTSVVHPLNVLPRPTLPIITSQIDKGRNFYNFWACHIFLVYTLCLPLYTFHELFHILWIYPRLLQILCISLNHSIFTTFLAKHLIWEIFVLPTYLLIYSRDKKYTNPHYISTAVA